MDSNYADLASIGRWLRWTREKLNVSTKELAERAGVSARMIQQIEAARSFPTTDFLRRLMLGLGMSTQILPRAGVTVSSSGSVSPIVRGAKTREEVLDARNRLLERALLEVRDLTASTGPRGEDLRRQVRWVLTEAGL